MCVCMCTKASFHRCGSFSVPCNWSKYIKAVHCFYNPLFIDVSHKFILGSFSIDSFETQIYHQIICN